MEIVIPSAHSKKIELPIPADIKKAFEKYLKNSITVDVDNENKDIEILMVSYLATFAASQEFKDMEQLAQEVKDEQKAMKEKAKAEREAKKAQREAEREAKKAEKIAKLQAEIDKLQEG